MSVRLQVMVNMPLSSQLLREFGAAYQACFQEPPWNESWTLEAATAQVKRCAAVGDLVLGLVDGKLGGFGIGVPLSQYSDPFPAELGVSMDAYYIWEIGTEPNYRRNGICARVIDELCLHAAAAHREVVVRTRHDNVALSRILLKKGFAAIGRYDAESGGVVSTREVFFKSLR